MPLVSTLTEIILSLVPAFTGPGFLLFQRLVAGWITCPSRRTITAVIPFADPEGIRHHTCYHRFIRTGAWGLEQVFRLWAKLLVSILCPEGRIWLTGDDTVHRKTGRKVDGAKYHRDPVRSNKKQTVYVWGLRFVILCLRVLPPWGSEPLSIPINLRLYRQGSKELSTLMEDMVKETADWFPGRMFHLVTDGFYASLAGRLPERVHLVSRMRRDAALYARAPQVKKRSRGRPRKKGKRLPAPAEMAKRAKKWKLVETIERGKKRQRLVHSRIVLWYAVSKERPLLLVISRDPEGKEKDDFFFSTDLSLCPERMVSEFANRWGIEDTFRNVKQFLGAEEPQSWKGEAPLKAAGFAYLLYGIVWLWYLRCKTTVVTLRVTPWYAAKSTPSFMDALAEIRRTLWANRFSNTPTNPSEFIKICTILIHALSRAA
jgi:hypothetical protein